MGEEVISTDEESDKDEDKIALLGQLVRDEIDKGRRIRFLSFALVTFRQNGTGVGNLCFREEDLGLAVATSDGLPFVTGLSDWVSAIKVAAELAGVDCDAVSVRARARHVWCASNDAVVRNLSLL
jgi:hypothetical protein